MRPRTVLTAAVAVLATVALQPAEAARNAGTTKPLTLFFHGTSANGNQDTSSGEPLPMDATKPSGSAGKEIAMAGGNVAGALLVPKPCPGGPYIPAWSRAMSGTVKGPVVVTFWARSTGGNVTVQLLNDPSDCTTAPAPAAQALVAVPQSPSVQQVTVSLPLPSRGVKVKEALWVQFLTDQTTTAPPGALGVTGISYDSTATPSAVTFRCLPTAGRKSC